MKKILWQRKHLLGAVGLVMVPISIIGIAIFRQKQASATQDNKPNTSVNSKIMANKKTDQPKKPAAAKPVAKPNSKTTSLAAGQNAAGSPTWSQDFTTYSSASLDPKYWNISDENEPIYNDEAQLYHNGSNTVRVENGVLKLEAHKTAKGYISGRVDTKGKVLIKPNSRLEASIKMPKGRGVWPAFWLLSDNQPYTSALHPTDSDWEQDRFYMHDGEIDIVELYGNQPNSVEATVHTFNKTYEADRSLNDGNFHTYFMDWTENQIQLGMDGQVYLTLLANSNSNAWPFTAQNNMYVILNLAMGGEGGGPIVQASGDSWLMQISKISYYQR